MNNNILNIKLMSQFITAYYQKLIKLTLNGMTESDEYQETIDKIKYMAQEENSIYKKLTPKEIKAIVEYFNQNEVQNDTDARIYTRTNDQNRLNDKNNINIDNQVPLSAVISSKIIIDVLKIVNTKILDLEITDDITEEDIIMLNAYNSVYKYKYLTANSFIEQLSLDNNFDIEEIPTINLYNIEKELNIEIISKAQNTFFNYIFSSIKELINLVSNDRHLYLYASLFELSRIEVMLPYLNKENLTKLSLHLSNLNINSNSIIKVKKLINKRKEELEK